MSCSSLSGSNFFVDMGIVILEAIVPVKKEMRHGMMVIIPIRCKMKSAQASCLDDWVDFMPVNTPHHDCPLGWDILLMCPVIFMAYMMLLSQNVFKCEFPSLRLVLSQTVIWI